MRWVCVLVFMSLLAMAGGCGGGEYDTAPVRGRVTAGGQPVTSGQVMFSPVMQEKSDRGINPGKAALGQVDASGNFVLSTYGDQDGAVIGRHRVSFLNAASDNEEDENKPPAYLLPEDKSEVEVASGNNEINLELVANPAAKNWRPARKRDD
jgi:hypothetical protein